MVEPLRLAKTFSDDYCQTLFNNESLQSLGEQRRSELTQSSMRLGDFRGFSKATKFGIILYQNKSF